MSSVEEIQHCESLSKSILKNFRWLLGFSIVANILLLAMPIHMITIYDRVLVSGSKETLLCITLIALIAPIALGGMAEKSEIQVQPLNASMPRDTGQERVEAGFIT